MDKVHFEWDFVYEGYWECPSCGNTIRGSLSLKNGKIQLELISIIQHNISTKFIPYIIGKVKSQKEGECVYIKLLNLKKTRQVFNLGAGDDVYTYDATDVFLSDCKESFSSPIKAVSINSFLLSKWASKTNQSAMSCTFDWGSIDFSYPHHEVSSDEENSFRQSRSSFIPMPTSHYGELPIKCFLNIKFSEQKENHFEATLFFKRILNLLGLLSQAPIDLGYCFYITDKGDFVHWNCLKHRFFLLEKTFSVTCNFRDITADEMSIFMQNWLDLNFEFTESIDTLFSVWEREMLPADQRLKSLMSVIDGLTNDFEMQGDGQTHDSKKKEEMNHILEKIRSTRCLSSGDFNRLSRAVNKESINSLGNRFCKMLKPLESLLPPFLNNKYAYKCTNTRHKLTHVESAQNDVFKPEEYIEVVHNLELIISAHLLYKIGIEEELIRKTLHLW